MVSFEVFIITLSLSVPLYWLLPSEWATGRQSVMFGTSLLIIFASSPVIFTWMSWHVLMFWMFLLARNRGVDRDTLKVVSWVAFLPMVASEFVPPTVIMEALGWRDVANDSRFSQLSYLGLSFCSIKAFMALREDMLDNEKGLWSAISAICFFGSFSAGPLSGSRPFRTSNLSTLKAADIALAICRIGWGFALFLVIKAKLDQLGLWLLSGPVGSSHPTLAAWVALYTEFIELYVDFAGYSGVAIGTALLFGIKLPENFRSPLLATSMQSFWQHWHLSLGTFIGTYLFKPMVRSTGSPVVSIICAFVAVGLWHRFDALYLIWGVGHGFALALNMKLGRRLPKALPPVSAVLVRFCGWSMTISWVVFLSAVANQSSLAEAGRLIGRLLGMH